MDTLSQMLEDYRNDERGFPSYDELVYVSTNYSVLQNALVKIRDCCHGLGIRFIDKIEQTAITALSTTPPCDDFTESMSKAMDDANMAGSYTGLDNSRLSINRAMFRAAIAAKAEDDLVALTVYSGGTMMYPSVKTEGGILRHTPLTSSGHCPPDSDDVVLHIYPPCKRPLYAEYPLASGGAVRINADGSIVKTPSSENIT